VSVSAAIFTPPGAEVGEPLANEAGDTDAGTWVIPFD
jgi:hypothetical protein